MKDKLSVLHMTINKVLKRKAKIRAAKEDISLAALVRIAIAEYLK